MPSDRPPADTEPASGVDAEDAGSVVVGLDPSGPAGLAVQLLAVNPGLAQERLDALALTFRTFHESFERSAPAMQARLAEAGRALGEFGRSWERARRTEFEFGGMVPRVTTSPVDAMRWTPPAEGEGIPSCPA